jgi:signal transduction histidine kinase
MLLLRNVGQKPLEIQTRYRMATQSVSLSKPARHYLMDAATIREDERTRIARELHDELGQYLVMLKFEVASLEKLAAAQALVPLGKITLISELVDSAVQSIRSLSAGLEPNTLRVYGLFTALEFMCRDFQRRTGIACSLSNALTTENNLNEPTRLAAFRIAQAALTNVLRHSKATRVIMSLNVTDTALILVIKDNGVGIPRGAERRPRCSGIRTMRERTAALGGTLTIESVASGGTEVTSHFPLK